MAKSQIIQTLKTIAMIAHGDGFSLR